GHPPQPRPRLRQSRRRLPHPALEMARRCWRSDLSFVGASLRPALAHINARNLDPEKQKARKLATTRTSGPRISVRTLLNFQEYDRKRVQRHRLNQHQRQNQRETNRRCCPRIARQTFASRRGGLRLSVTARRRSYR